MNWYKSLGLYNTNWIKQTNGHFSGAGDLELGCEILGWSAIHWSSFFYFPFSQSHSTASFSTGRWLYVVDPISNRGKTLSLSVPCWGPSSTLWKLLISDRSLNNGGSAPLKVTSEYSYITFLHLNSSTSSCSLLWLVEKRLILTPLHTVVYFNIQWYMMLLSSSHILYDMFSKILICKVTINRVRPYSYI